ncbi:30S ribosomal protein S13 [Archaeoglobales archaeon]|nr:MAG: 30S ribosomal protein S13 [Archaeoglobales archaeon]
MISMSSFDIRACVNELQALIDGKIEKIYHYPPDEIRIKVYSKEGRKDLIIEAGRRIHLTKFPKQSPRFPSSFAMILRKHLEGGRIRKIEQYDFDRIVKIEIERKEEKKTIIAELFSKGNVILANEDLEIIMPLKFRFKPKEVYRFPEPRNPVELVDYIDGTKDKEIVRALANIGLGGLYAEEVCLRANIDKNRKVEELSDGEVSQIKNVVTSLFKAVEKPEPQIIIKDGNYHDVVPLSLKYYEKYEKKFFDEFNSALDEFYSKKIVEMAEMEEKKSEKLEKLKKRLEMQFETKKRFEEEIEKYKRIGDLIYENYSTIEKIMDAFKKAREKMSWDEIRNFLDKNKDKQGVISLIKSVSPKNNSITIELEYPVELSLNKTIHQIADEYYNKAKKIKEKLDGLLKAIEKTKEDMEKVEEIEAKKYVESIRVVRKREWFERFRWFVTSDGFLVIGGRNAAMNEEIVSKYLETNDLFFHTQTPGAPATILKNGQNAPEQSLIEAAKFAVTYSALWKEGKYGGDVYYVKPEQVKRTAKAGEYLPKGSFYIVGKREYIKASVSCGVGVEMDKFRVFGGPITAVKKYCDYYVELDIGNESPNELSKEIAFKLISMAKEGEKHLVRSIATPDEIMKFLPPGKSRIKEIMK